MSFALTTTQFVARTKTVTRRVGWSDLKPGEQFMGVEKGMGLKKGQKINRLHAAECVSNRRERVDAISQDDVISEGFPDWTREQFINFFCQTHRCLPSDEINRIEFKHLP